MTSVRYTLSGDGATMGLAWTEARDYVGYFSDSSNGNFRGPGGTLISQDGAIMVPITAGSSVCEVPVERLRAGFRYLTVYILTNGTSTLAIEDVSVEIVFQPTWSNLRAYPRLFPLQRRGDQQDLVRRSIPRFRQTRLRPERDALLLRPSPTAVG